MDDGKTETLYLQRRVSDSLAMAAAATESCAQIAHMELARLYGEAIDTIVAQPRRPTLHTLFRTLRPPNGQRPTAGPAHGRQSPYSCIGTE